MNNLKFKNIELNFGNLCNLACRMCGPTDSHTWYEQWLGYHGGDGFQDTHGYVKLEQNNKSRLSTTDYLSIPYRIKQARSNYWRSMVQQRKL